MSWLDEVPWVEETVHDMSTGQTVKRRLRPMTRNAAGAWVDPFAEHDTHAALAPLEQAESAEKHAADDIRNPGLRAYVEDSVVPRMQNLELD